MTAVDSTVEQVRMALLAFDDLAEVIDLDRGAALLVELRDLRKWLAAVHDHLEDRVIALMGESRRTDVADVGRLIRYDGKKRTHWRHDELYPVALSVARRNQFDPATGEAIPADEALLATLKLGLAPAYWRSGVLRSWGVEPDDYAEVTTTRPAVEVK